ncbi:S-layer homology domain-containing protein [Leptolyngbya iicbica]|uniref:S-layer homology domain-containing protein n=2 Tax=Cyanophyceae TaxID=3028117 RepID=A0A4Q7E2J0_9CYAN|nr:S-layer homology domain-containing protein [Leptolyngbya sp. LK]RZM76640.1 S-layer homology domain-containing protein [Leptolyngbya sp. LK]
MVNLPPPESNDQQPAGQSRDNDEAIAIAIALLSVGAILWWGWTRGESIFAPDISLPGLADSPSLVEDESLTTVPGDATVADDADNPPTEETANRRGFFGGLFFFGNGEATGSDNAARLAEPDVDETVEDEATDANPDRNNPLSSGAAVPTTGTGTSAATPGQASANINATGQSAESATDGTTAAPSDAASSATTDAEPAPLPELSISDVSEDYWAYPYIVSLFEAGLLPDFPSGTLQPDKPLTRAELAALLNKSIVADVPPKRSLNFSDVPPDYWAANDIKQVVEAGYMSGFPEGIFQPNAIVPRYQVYITMATGLDLAPPADVDGTINQYQGTESLPTWARAQVAAAASQGMVVNHPDPQQLAPQAPATRADLIATIHQALVAQGRIAPIDNP